MATVLKLASPSSSRAVPGVAPRNVRPPRETAKTVDSGAEAAQPTQDARHVDGAAATSSTWRASTTLSRRPRPTAPASRATESRQPARSGPRGARGGGPRATRRPTEPRSAAATAPPSESSGVRTVPIGRIAGVPRTPHWRSARSRPGSSSRGAPAGPRRAASKPTPQRRERGLVGEAEATQEERAAAARDRAARAGRRPRAGRDQARSTICEAVRARGLDRPGRRPGRAGRSGGSAGAGASRRGPSPGAAA